MLSDPVQRAKYDLHHGFVEETKRSLTALNREQRQQAVKEKQLMAMDYQTKKKKEDNKTTNGVVVLSAMYGNFKAYVNSRKPIHRSATGNVMDATVQIQCMIEGSKLRIEGGSSKTVTCGGLYNPSFDEHGTLAHTKTQEEPRLCVRYMFKGHQHQVVVTDQQELVLPLVSHRLDITQWCHYKSSKSSKNKGRKKSKMDKKNEKAEKVLWGCVNRPTQIREEAKVNHDRDTAAAQARNEGTYQRSICVVTVVTAVAAGVLVYLYRSKK